jgi:hypothetical protein
MCSSFRDLKISSFDAFDTLVDIVDGIFGGREKYLQAIREVQQAIYV